LTQQYKEEWEYTWRWYCFSYRFVFWWCL